MAPDEWNVSLVWSSDSGFSGSSETAPNRYFPVLRPAGEKIFLVVRQPSLDSLAADLIEYGRVWQMSRGDRHFKELNGELVASTAAEVDTLRPPPLRNTYPLERILNSYGIDPGRYQAFRTRLRRTGFIEVCIERYYVAFLYDGMLDNLFRFLWVRPAGNPPRMRTELFGGHLSVLERHWGRWYYFATT